MRRQLEPDERYYDGRCPYCGTMRNIRSAQMALEFYIRENENDDNTFLEESRDSLIQAKLFLSDIIPLGHDKCTDSNFEYWVARNDQEATKAL